MSRLHEISKHLPSALRKTGVLLKDSFNKWLDDNAPRLGAAIAFYTISSLAPLLVIAIGVAALFFGRQAAEGRIVAEMGSLVGGEGAKAIETMLAAARQKDSGLLATILGIITLLVASTGLFSELKSSLNDIWKVKPLSGASAIKSALKTRLLSFTMVLGIGFLLLVSLLISAVISALGASLQRWVPEYPLLLQIANQFISFGIITALFAMMYKVLPDVDITWRDVWVGAAVTAVLFTLGKFLIGLYLGRSSVASAYGAAGSFVIILIWIYYSALLFFFGAAFTFVFTQRHGSQKDASELRPCTANP
jgi:membrane protein